MNIINTAFAEATKVPETLGRGPDDLVCLIAKVSDWMFTVLLALAVIFIVLAAYKYLTSQGGEEVSKVHKMLMYAAIAVAVAVLSRGFVTVVQKIVGGAGVEGCSSQLGGPGQQNNGGGSNTNQNNEGSNQNNNGGAVNNVPAPLGFTRSDNAERPFDARVFKCSDGLIPGVLIKYDINGDRDGLWSNFNTGEGNLNIPGKAKADSPDPVYNAGDYGIVGSIHTGIQTPFGGLGDGYDFTAETCNDGAIPIIQVDIAQDGSFERVTP